jgi:hypothetical protein
LKSACAVVGLLSLLDRKSGIVVAIRARSRHFPPPAFAATSRPPAELIEIGEQAAFLFGADGAVLVAALGAAAEHI